MKNLVTRKNLNKLAVIGTTASLMFMKANVCLAASGIGTTEVDTATENIKRVITSIAMPLGGVLIFASVVILGASLIISGIIINVATNNTGSLLGG